MTSSFLSSAIGITQNGAHDEYAFHVLKEYLVTIHISYHILLSMSKECFIQL